MLCLCIHSSCLHTQSPISSLQDGVTYSLVGMDTGPTYFSINPSTGQITVKSDLKTDRYRKDPYIVSTNIEHIYFS